MALLGVCLALETLAQPVRAQANPAAASAVGVSEHPPGELAIKAAFVYNFIKFADWPADYLPEATSISVCLIDEEANADVFEQTIQAKLVNRKPLAVKRVKGNSDLRKCHVLFIGLSEAKPLTDIFKSLGQSSVLTVGESGEFAKLGGMIRFVREGSRMRFEINLNSVERVGIKLGSQLLAVAILVGKEKPGRKY